MSTSREGAENGHWKPVIPITFDQLGITFSCSYHFESTDRE
jgi:hypothetical protein